MVTSRAYLVGGMGFCFYLILLFNTNLPNQFYALSWLSVGVLVSSLGVAVLSMLGLDCQWRIQNARVSEDIESWHSSNPEQVAAGPTIQLELGNSGSFNKTDLLFEVQLFCSRRDEHLSRSFLIEALPAGNSLTCDLPLGNLPRGRYSIEGVTIHGGDVLGLFRLRRRFALTTGELEDLIVGPASVVPQRETQASGLGLLEGALRAATGRGSGDDFRGTRHYVPGDDLRTVHWRSTARRGQLVVKEFHHQEQTQRLIIWDGATGFSRGEGPHASTECALRLVASLSNALAARGRRCGVLRLDSQPFYLPAPGGRGINTDQVIELLADADAAREAPLSSALGPFLRHLGTANEVFLITQAPTPEVLRAVTALRNRGARVTVALIEATAFMLRDEEPARPENPKNLKAPDASNTEEYLKQVQLLQHAGVPVVLIPDKTQETEEIAHSGAAQMQILRLAVRDLMAAQNPKRQLTTPGNSTQKVA
jgi:uncharacterized protein (DUF58 family)